MNKDFIIKAAGALAAILYAGTVVSCIVILCQTHAWVPLVGFILITALSVPTVVKLAKKIFG